MKLTDMTTAAASRSGFNSGPRGKNPPLKSQGPRLETIQMVATAIRGAEEYPSRYKLLRDLPKGMVYETLDQILEYLESTNQIMIDKDGAIIWILADNPKRKKLLAETKSF